ncbi:UvrD-helicase domain-containing protein, partial [Klebsiella pneumoniae]|uniref:UvrD-helicase domain-containing protein n=1 Tax=Klebsiella pneumoniae TaxID=573 RepID=UPI003F522DDC
MHKIRKACNKWLELAEIYGTYREKLHRQGFYDYSDMLLEVIVQLEKDRELLSDIQEKYNYVLIDEFQDSNSAQLRLA